MRGGQKARAPPTLQPAVPGLGSQNDATIALNGIIRALNIFWICEDAGPQERSWGRVGGAVLLVAEDRLVLKDTDLG